MQQLSKHDTKMVRTSIQNFSCFGNLYLKKLILLIPIVGFRGLERYEHGAFSRLLDNRPHRSTRRRRGASWNWAPRQIGTLLFQNISKYCIDAKMVKQNTHWSHESALESVWRDRSVVHPSMPPFQFPQKHQRNYLHCVYSQTGLQLCFLKIERKTALTSFVVNVIKSFLVWWYFLEIRSIDTPEKIIKYMCWEMQHWKKQIWTFCVRKREKKNMIQIENIL